MYSLSMPARVNGDSWRLIIHSPGAWYVAHGANEPAQWHQYLSFPCASVCLLCVCAGLRQWAERHNGSDLQCHLHGGQAIICGCLTCISESEAEVEVEGGTQSKSEADKASARPEEKERRNRQQSRSRSRSRS